MTTPSQGRRCSMCGETGKEMGKNYRCRDCDKVYFAQYRAGKREELNRYMREYRARNREAFALRNKERRRRKTPEEMEKLHAYEAAKTRRLNAVLKDKVFMAYGGWVCACCGETEKSFLTIDHINNDGYKLRKVQGHSSDFYRWLKNHGFPSGYQVLCMNCQFGKRMNNGICPHVASRCDGQSIVLVGSSDPKRRGSTEMVDHDMTCSVGKLTAVREDGLRVAN